MKMHKIISLVALLVAGIQLSDAQQLPVFNNYFLNPFFYNPARAGSDPDGGRINLGFQNNTTDSQMVRLRLTVLGMEE
jgi:hypothetical protein